MSEEFPDFYARLIDAIADRVVARLGARPVSERILVNDVPQHGAPSVNWLREQARLTHIALHGPRGGRYVLRADLESLLASSSIKRTRVVPNATPVVSDIVAELAAKRSAA